MFPKHPYIKVKSLTKTTNYYTEVLNFVHSMIKIVTSPDTQYKNVHKEVLCNVSKCNNKSDDHLLKP